MQHPPVGDHHMGAAGGRDAAGLDLGAHAAARQFRGRAARHRLDLRRHALDDRDEPRIRIFLRRRGVEAPDIGEQDQKVGARHGGDAGGEPVIVAVTDLAGRDRVVLVDDGDGPHGGKPAERLARVEVAAALLGILGRHENLAGDDAVMAQSLGPVAGQRDLPHGGRALALLQAQGAGRKAQHRPAEGDAAGGHHQHVDAAPVQLRDVLGQRREPGVAQAAGTAIDQQGRADLDDHTAEFFEGRDHDSCENACSSRV